MKNKIFKKIKKEQKNSNRLKDQRFTFHSPRFTTRAQATLEFLFCVFVLMLMVYGMIRVFEWTGRDLADRRMAHDQTLINKDASPDEQLELYFHAPRKMRAVFGE